MIIVFTIPALGVGEEAPVNIRMYQSDTNDGVRTQVGLDTLISGLPEDAGEYTWDELLADDQKYTWLTFLTVGGTEGQPTLLPPKPADPTSVTIFAYTIDAGLGVLAGEDFSAQPSGSHASFSDKTVIKSSAVETDDNGYAEITIPAEAGQFEIRLGPIMKRFDTTGKTGQSLNFNTL